MAVLFLVMQVGEICLILDPDFLSSGFHRVLQQTQREVHMPGVSEIPRFSPATNM